MSQHGDEETVGIARVHQDGGNLLAVAQPQMTPGLAPVDGLVHAVAGGKIGTLQSFAGAHVDDVGVGRRERDGADGTGGLVVEDGLPGAADVVRLPHAAIVHADVEDVGLGGNAGGADGAPAAEGADVAPAESGVVCGGERLGGEQRGDAGKQERSTKHSYKSIAPDALWGGPAGRPQA